VIEVHNKAQDRTKSMEGEKIERVIQPLKSHSIVGPRVLRIEKPEAEITTISQAKKNIPSYLSDR